MIEKNVIFVGILKDFSNAGLLGIVTISIMQDIHSTKQMNVVATLCPYRSTCRNSSNLDNVNLNRIAEKVSLQPLSNQSLLCLA